MPRLLNRMGFGLPPEAPANIGATLACVSTLDIQAAAPAADGKPPGPPTFESWAYKGGPMKLAGWTHPVIIDLDGFKASRQTMPALRDHEFTRVVGHTTEVAITAAGVHVKGVISGAGADAQEVITASRNGFPWQASHGTNPGRGAVEHLALGKTATVNGRRVEGPMSIVRRAVMHEFTFTPVGADSETTTAIAASHSDEEISQMTFSEWLKAQGWDESALSPAQKTTLNASFDAEVKASAGNDGADLLAIQAKAGVDIKAMIATAVESAAKTAIEQTTATIRAAAELDAALERACAGYPELLAKAKAEKWSIDRAELMVERANRPQPMFPSTVADGAPESGQVIRAALCVNGGMDDASLKVNFDEKTINAAMSSRLRGFGIHALMYETIRAAGRSIAPGIIGDSFIRQAFEAEQQIKASGVSTLSLATTLGDVVNKFIVAGIGSVDQTWRQIASIGSVKDFRTTTGVRLTGDMKYLKLGQDGEIKHATMAETTYANRAETYARMFALTRQDLINDDLGNLEQTARLRLGRGAGKALNDAFWTEFMNNSAFFTAARGNYDEDTDTALAVAGLTLAEALFRNQTDEDGDPAEIEPAILLVPNQLRTTADILMSTGNILPDSIANVNPWAGKFKVVSNPYLSNSNFTGYSTTAWYLLADPNALGVGVIQVVFLNGKQVPTVESAELDFNMLGIQMRGYLDVGVAKQEYRAGVQMAGVNV